MSTATETRVINGVDVAKVEQLMALVDALETLLAASRATAAKLLDALVAELTAREPSGFGRATREKPKEELSFL